MYQFNVDSLTSKCLVSDYLHELGQVEVHIFIGETLKEKDSYYNYGDLIKTSRISELILLDIDT